MLKKKHGELIERAQKVREYAYAPYSNYKVGAAVLARDGRIFTGCNVENISYGGTVCAEQVAFFTGIAQGATDFIAMAIVIDGNPLGVPCGICRQVMSEHISMPHDFVIISTNVQGEVKVWSLAEIFPQPFAPEHLGKERNYE